MARPEGKSTKGAHLRQVEKHTGKSVVPDNHCPKELEHVWIWFLELTAARGSNGFGPNPISYAELQAWSLLTKQNPTPWEISLLKRLDKHYLIIMAKEK